MWLLATETITIAQRNKWILPIGLDTLTIGRAHLGLALVASTDAPSTDSWRDAARTARDKLYEAVEGLQAYSDLAYVARGLLARAALCRGLGDWDGAAGDLDEVEEIAEPGPMKLHLCDMALERPARFGAYRRIRTAQWAHRPWSAEAKEGG
jgi:hypothetical protein